MQLISESTRRLIPITIASGLLIGGSSFTFLYDAIGSSEIKAKIDSPYANKIIHDPNSINYSHYSLQMRFEYCVKTWKRNTAIMSFSEQIVNEKHFREIISMGQLAVPLILDSIKEKPSPLVWALNMILNRTVSTKSNLTIEEACKLWVKSMA